MMRFAATQPGIPQFLTSGPDYGGILDLGMQARSKERQTGYKAEANIRVNALDAMAKIKAAKHEAKGIIAGGQAPPPGSSKGETHLLPEALHFAAGAPLAASPVHQKRIYAQGAR